MIFMICGCTKKLSNKKTAEKDLPQIRIGVDILKPFFYIDQNGNYAGIDADIAREACKRAGYEPKFIEIPWSERNTYLKNNKVDCLWTAFIKDNREDQYLWTDSYMTSQLAIIVDQNCPSKKLSDFRGPSGIAVRAGSTSEEILLEKAQKTNSNLENIYSCGTFSQAVTAYIKGYADALSSHKIVLQYLMEENPKMYRYLEENLKSVHLGVAFKKEDNNIYWKKIEKAITEMKKDGTIAKIQKKYEISESEKSGIQWQKNKLTKINYQEKTWYGIHWVYNTYSIYVLYPYSEVFASQTNLIAIALMIYLAAGVVILSIQRKSDRKNIQNIQKQLRIINAISTSYTSTI